MTENRSSLSLSSLLVLAVTAVIPLAVATGFSNFERPRHLLLAGLAALALTAWGAGLVRHGSARMASPGTVVSGVVFTAFVAGSLAWSTVPLFGLLSVITWVSLAAVFLVIAAPVGRPLEFLDWATAVGVGTLGAGALGVYELFGGGALTPVWNPSGVAGGFDAISFAATYYAVAIPVLVGALALSRGVRRWFFGAALLLGMLHFGVVVDLLVLGLLAGAMVIIGAAVHLRSGAAPGRSSALAAAVAVLTLAIAMVGIFAFERPDQPSAAVDLPRIAGIDSFEVETAIDPRASWFYFARDRTEAPLDYRYQSYLNRVARGLWDKEPLLGHGAGGWWLMQNDVMDDADPHINQLFERYPAFRSPHNDFARVSVEQGGLGFVFFVLWLLGLLTAGLGFFSGHRLGDEESRVVAWALLTTLVMGLVLMVFTPFLELASSAVVWVGAGAMILTLVAREGSKKIWLSSWRFGQGSLPLRIGVAAACLAVAGAIVIPSAQHGMAALERGYADHLMLRMQFPDAIEHYERAHATYPAHGEVPFNIALAHYMMGQSMDGLESIEEALRLRPYDARLLSHAGYLAVRDHRIDSALHYGNQAVRTGPNYLQGYEVYGSALQRRARYEDTANLFRAALDRDLPRRQRGTMRYRYAHILDEQLQRYEEALEQYELAMQELPPGPERTLVDDRIEVVERRLMRSELEAAGEPIPPHLHPDFDQPDHHDHHHHGPGHDHDHAPEFLPPGIDVDPREMNQGQPDPGHHHHDHDHDHHDHDHHDH